MSKWSREAVIRKILERESAGLSLIGEQGGEPNLYRAGIRIFGSWRNALLAAGISRARSERCDSWSPSKVLRAIRAISRRRHPLRPRELHKRFSHLVAAARRIFGGWDKAVIAAGVDPAMLRVSPPWTRPRIVEAILIRALKNEPLGSRSVSPRSLADAGARLFGGWALALTAAGLDPRQFGCRVLGSTMSIAYMRVSQRQQSLAHVPAIGHANDALFCPSNASLMLPKRRWTNETIIYAIRTRAADHRALNATSVDRDESTLYRAALRRFGSWQAALMASGLNPEEFRMGGRGEAKCPVCSD